MKYIGIGIEFLSLPLSSCFFHCFFLLLEFFWSPLLSNEMRWFSVLARSQSRATSQRPVWLVWWVYRSDVWRGIERSLGHLIQQVGLVDKLRRLLGEHTVRAFENLTPAARTGGTLVTSWTTPARGYESQVSLINRREFAFKWKPFCPFLDQKSPWWWINYRNRKRK
jgi:hypothetical protein